MRGHCASTIIGLGTPLALVLGLVYGVPAQAVDPPPNVLVILIDDARTDEMDTMPVVSSSIAAAGATFSNSYAPFPLCCPDRATLLTGQYAHNHGVLGNEPPLGGFPAFDDSRTLAMWLGPAYDTAWVGKYLNAYGEDATSIQYVPPGWDTWNAAVAPIDYRRSTFSINGQTTVFDGQYRTDVTRDLALDFLTEATQDPTEPFFLFTSFNAPHSGTPAEPDDPNRVYGSTRYKTPNVADEFRDAFADRPLDVNPAFNEADVSDKPVRPPALQPWEIDALTEVSAQRRESLLSVDAAIQQMIGLLTESGQLENTYVIFTSDNGYLLGEHRLQDGKNVLYEPAVSVPLYIRGPGIAAGTVVPQLVGAQDVAPTILSMAGLSGTQGDFVVDGVDLLPMIDDPTLYAERPIVLEVGPAPANPDGPYRFRGIRTPQWKYWERSSGRAELYDMVRDPFELRNVVRDPQYADVRAEMDALLEQYKNCAGESCR